MMPIDTQRGGERKRKRTLGQDNSNEKLSRVYRGQKFPRRGLRAHEGETQRFPILSVLRFYGNVMDIALDVAEP